MVDQGPYPLPLTKRGGHNHILQNIVSHLFVRGKPRNLNQKRKKNGPGRRLSEQSVLLMWLEGKYCMTYPITLRKAKTSVPPYLPLSTGLTDPDSPQSDRILTYI